eukprot:3918528-Prymnesium_polylepis.1
MHGNITLPHRRWPQPPRSHTGNPTDREGYLGVARSFFLTSLTPDRESIVTWWRRLQRWAPFCRAAA